MHYYDNYSYNRRKFKQKTGLIIIMGKKNKKTKQKRLDAANKFHQKAQQDQSGSTTHGQAGELSKLINNAIANGHSHKNIANETGLQLRDVHNIVSNPNHNIPNGRKSDAIATLETLGW